jgi:ATP-binding cassette, subfamily C, bacterial
MVKAGFVIKNFSNFLQFNSKHLYIIYGLTVLLAFTQGVSFVLLIPLLNLLDLQGSADDSFVNRVLSQLSDNLNFALSLEVLLVFYVLILAVLFFLQYGRAVLQSAYQQKYSGFVRKDLYRRVIFSEWSFLSKMSKSQHLQTLTSEISRATHFYFYLLSATTKVVIILIHIAIACFVSWKLTLLVVGWGLFQFVFLSKYFKKSYTIGQMGRKTFRKVLRNIDDFWITIKPAKIHNTEQFYYENFAKADDSFVGNQVEQFRHNQKPYLLFRMLGLINMVAVVLVSQYWLNIPLAFLFVLVLLFSRIMPLFMNIYNDVNVMFLNAESLENIQKAYFQKTLEVTSGQNINARSDLMFNNGNVKVQNIVFTYDNNSLIFDGFSTEIHANRITAIVGRSGRGKTTLIDLISGLLIPQQGRILIDDVPLNSENAYQIRKYMGYLPQESLFIDGTIRENLVWDAQRNISDDELWNVLRSVNAEVFLKKKVMDLETDVTNFKYSFSGGELQRLALARVLLRKPRLLILDEATSALDEHNEDIIIDVLKELKKSTTIIFVTHKKRLQDSFDWVVKL